VVPTIAPVGAATNEPVPVVYFNMPLWPLLFKPVPPYCGAIIVPFQVPVEIVPMEFKLDAVVKDAKDVTSVATNVFVPDGNVALVVAVVVRVKLLAPEVIKVDPSTMVKVDDDAGAVTVSLLYVDAETFPF
jgi:hypothetical protein